MFPRTPQQRVFGIFFACLGIAVLGGVALGIVFNLLLDAFKNVTTQNKTKLQSKFLHKLEVKFNTTSIGGEGRDNEEEEEEPAKKMQLYKRIAVGFCTYAIIVGLGG